MDRGSDKTKIFISYTIRDGFITISKLSELCIALSCFGCVFADVIHNDSDDRQRRVEEELRAADIVVFLKTEAFNTSKWVFREQMISKEYNKNSLTIDVEVEEPWVRTVALVKSMLFSKLV